MKKVRKGLFLLVFAICSLTIIGCSKNKVKVKIETGDGIKTEYVQRDFDPIDLKAPEKAGYYFKHFLKEDGQIFNKGDKIEGGTLKLKAVYEEKDQASEYNIAALSATMPALIFSLEYINKTNFIKQKDNNGNNIPTYIWLSRQKSLNVDEFSGNIKPMPCISTYEYKKDLVDTETSSEMFKIKMTNKISNMIKEIVTKNPDAKINLYIGDFQPYLFYKMIIANNVKNYSVKILSDGSYSAISFYEVFNKENSEKINSHIDSINKKLELLEQQVKAKPNYEVFGAKLGDYSILANDLRKYTYLVAKKYSDKISWVIKTYSLKSTKGYADATEDYKTLVSDVLANDRVSENPAEGFIYEDNLGTNIKAIINDENKKTELENVFNFKEGLFPNDFVVENSIVLLGTRTNSENNFKDYVNFIKKYYPNKKILYKGHPATPTSADDKKASMLNDMGIWDVDSVIPAELIFALNPTLSTIGYYSTTFSSLEKEQVIALFNNDSTYSGDNSDKFSYYVKELTAEHVHYDQYKDKINKDHKYLIAEKNSGDTDCPFKYILFDLTDSKLEVVK